MACCVLLMYSACTETRLHARRNGIELGEGYEEIAASLAGKEAGQ